MTDKATLQALLDCPMDPDNNDAQASSLGEYLLELSRQVWIENEGFSGKRPFGNGGWEFDVYNAVAAAGLMESVTRTYSWGDEISFSDTEERRIDDLISEALLHSRVVVN
jgi:hypothetical protein